MAESLWHWDQIQINKFTQHILVEKTIKNVLSFLFYFSKQALLVNVFKQTFYILYTPNRV